MIKVILMLTFFICSGTGGEIAMTYGMKQIGEPESFRPLALLRFVGTRSAMAGCGLRCHCLRRLSIHFLFCCRGRPSAW